ncbi:restriction endonuclease subunit S [Saccharothrix isguenensis]
MAGGTPEVNNPAYWTDSPDDGHAWVSISDMSNRSEVATTSRRITKAGLQSARLHVAPPGTLLFSMYASLGHTAVLQKSACWNQAILGVIPTRKDVDQRFLKYSLMSLREKLTAQARSNTQDNLNAEQVRNLTVPYPNSSEQHRIANFLDVEISQIDRLITLKESQFRVIQEKHDASIAKIFTVSGCVRPIRLKRLLRARPRYGVLVPTFVSRGVPFIRVNDLLNLEGRTENLVHIPEKLSAQYRTTIVREGDLLVSVVGTLGRAAVASKYVVGANVNRAIAILRPNPGVSTGLLHAWVSSTIFTRQALDATASDSAQRTLGMEDLSNFVVAWPADPRTQYEMEQAAARIEASSRMLKEIVSAQSNLLAQRRQELITAAVTGQLDVTTARSGVH